MTTLALPKKTFKVSMSSWWNFTVMIDKEPDRVSIIKDKKVVVIDWKTINWSYIWRIEEIDAFNDKAETALAWARTHAWPIRDILMMRIKSYEQSMGHKISVEKLQKFYKNFFTHGLSDEHKDVYKKYIDQYIASWWDINQIWSWE